MTFFANITRKLNIQGQYLEIKVSRLLLKLSHFNKTNKMLRV